VGQNITVALIGAGYLGQFHAQKLADLQTAGFCEFTGVFDVNLSSAKKITEKFPSKIAFSSLAELLSKNQAVVIAANTLAHYPLAKQCLEAGLHVNVEKPICEKVSEARELISLAHSKKLVLTVGHSERFNPGYRFLREKFFKPSHLEFRRLNPFKDRSLDVSVVHDLMIHDLDLLFSWDRSGVKDFFADGQKVVSNQLDWASAFFKMNSGLSALIKVSRVHHVPDRTISVVSGASQASVNLVTMEASLSEGKSEPVKTLIEKADHLFLENQEFLAAIKNQRAPLISADDGYQALVWTEKIMQKIKA
jgi:predicted dehydrogenase